MKFEKVTSIPTTIDWDAFYRPQTINEARKMRLLKLEDLVEIFGGAKTGNDFAMVRGGKVPPSHPLWSPLFSLAGGSSREVDYGTICGSTTA